MSPLQVLLLVYAGIGCLYWAWMAIGSWLVVRGVPRMIDLDPPELAVWPKLSILIPACNEGQTIEAAIKTVLKVDYPDLEIVLIDDRSSDATGEIVDRVAGADHRVCPVHVTELPDGWLGKVHALHQGVRRATGDFLLMMDADVHLEPGMLRRAIAYCEEQRIDHLAAAPKLLGEGFLLRVVIAMFLRAFCVGMRIWAVSHPRSSAFIGIGAFNLVRRTAFEQTEGFAWLRLEVADDVGLGLMMKRSGARSAIVNANRHAAVEWYRSLGDMAVGVEKGYASVAHCSLRRLLGVCAVVSALELAPVVALLPLGTPGLMPMGLFMVGCAVASVLMLGLWAGDSIFPGLFSPLAALLGIGLMLRAGWLGWRRGGILWRGTLYPNDLLRGNLRVKWP